MREAVSHYFPMRDPFGFQSFGRAHYLFATIILFLQVVSAMNGTEWEMNFLMTFFCKSNLQEGICSQQYQKPIRRAIEYLAPVGGGVTCICLDPRWSRKGVIYIGLIVYCFGSVIPLLYSSEAMIFLYTFVSTFSAIIFQTAARVLLIETIPNNRIDIMSALLLLASYFGRSLFAYTWFGHGYWHEVVLSKFLLSIIGLFSVALLPESPRWYFMHNNLESSIMVLEDIARMNQKEGTAIRNGIEEAWLATRTRPKSQDTFLDMFYYSQVRHVFLKSAVAFLIDCSAYHISMALSTIHSYKFQQETIMVFCAMAIGIGYFSVLTKRYGRRKCIAYGCLVGSLAFLAYGLSWSLMLHFVFAKIGLLSTSFVLFNIETVIVELSPTALSVTIIVIFNCFIYTLSSLIVHYAKPWLKRFWLGSIIVSICLSVVAYFMSDVPETKGTSVPASTWEAESFLAFNHIRHDNQPE